LLNGYGKVWVPLEFDSIRWLDKGFLLVRQNANGGVLHVENGTTKEIVPVSFSDIQYAWFDRLFICKKTDGTITLYNEFGEVLPSRPKPDNDPNSLPFAEGISVPPNAVSKKNSKYYLLVTTVTMKERESKKIPYDTVATPYDSIIIDTENDMIMVRQKNKWGVISKKGSVLLEPKYELIDPEKSQERHSLSVHDYCVRQQKKWGVVRNILTEDEKLMESRIEIPFEYDAIENYGGKHIILRKKDLYGIASKSTLKLITPVKYQMVSTEWVNTYMDFVVFMVTDGKMKDVYVGENGIEFYRK
jgi:hypothetical protein